MVCYLPRRQESKAFTLIELLVVISIIAVLMSIMMPALTKVREQAKKSVCMSNLSQISKASYLYATDNSGHMAHQYANHPNHLVANPLTKGYNFETKEETNDSWVANINQYVQDKNFYSCPANKNTDRNWMPTEDNDIAYCANGVVTHLGKIELFKRPSGVVSFMDDALRSNVSVVRPYFASRDATNIRTERLWSGWMRYGSGSLLAQPHFGGRCYTFIDGHTDYAKLEDVTSKWMALLIGPNLEDAQEPEGVSSYGDSRRTGVITFK